MSSSIKQPNKKVSRGKPILKLRFIPVLQDPWGFQPLEPVSELWDGKNFRIGVLFKTYRNDPALVPGKVTWVFALDGQGGWLAESQDSENCLRSKVLAILQVQRK